MTTDPLADLSVSARRLLADPPVTEKMLVELTPVWLDLPPVEADIADAIRLFVITWDPLELSPQRPPAFAAVSVDSLELAVYVPVWSLSALAAAHDVTIVAVLTAAATSVVTTSAANRDVLLSGDYPNLVLRGEAPDLVGDLAEWLDEPNRAVTALGQPRFAVTSQQWEDIGLGMIQDAVQHAFGIVDLDRSPVELAARRPEPGCPACAGERFGFPADLAESRDEMCLVHRGEAEGVIKRRLARAEVSNPAGWHAILQASIRLEAPHLPNGLATKLVGAVDQEPEPEVLVECAHGVVEAARWFEARPDDLCIALGEDPDPLTGLPDWLVELPLDLARAGQGAEAALAGEALGRVAPACRAMFEDLDQLAVVVSERKDAQAQRQGRASIVRQQRRRAPSRAKRKR